MEKISNDSKFIQSPTVKLICSYGGKFHSPPLYEKLSYVRGYTENLTVDRHIKFADFLAKLKCLSDFTKDRYCIKFELPGEILVSLNDEDDLESMMIEYDSLQGNISPEEHVSLRLFILSFAECLKMFNCGSNYFGIPDYLFGFDDEYDYSKPPKPYKNTIIDINSNSTTPFDLQSWMIPKVKDTRRSITTCSVEGNRSENKESHDAQHVANGQYMQRAIPPVAMGYNSVRMPVQNGGGIQIGGGFLPVNHYGREIMVLVDGVNGYRGGPVYPTALKPVISPPWMNHARTAAFKVCHRNLVRRL